MIYATIDMGTNTIRLLVARKKDGCDFEFLHQESRIARIGEGFGKRKVIGEAALKKTKEILINYRKIIDSYGAQKVFIAATSAIREAENKLWFIENIKKLGFKIEVISPHREAYLTHLGIIYSLKDRIRNKKWTAFDLGGGSTEFIFSEDKRLIDSFSIPLGAVKLLERHIRHDPPTTDELNKAANEFSEELAKKLKGKPETEIVVGNAGTVTSLAAIDMGLTQYSYKKTEGYILKRANIEKTLNTMLTMKAEERLKYYKILEKGREDVIVVGAKVVLLILDYFETDYLVTTNGSLREGLLVEKVCNEGEA